MKSKVTVKIAVLLCALAVIGCSNSPVMEVGGDTYTIARDDHAGIFGNMNSFRAEVLKDADDFAKEKGKEAVRVSYWEKPVGTAPADWARIEYTFKLVDKDALKIEDPALKAIDFSDTRALKTDYFSGSDLNLIEGIWSWSDDTYQAAIIKNTYSMFTGYEYLGLVTMTARSSWTPGDVKLLLNSTASPNIFTGSYIMGNKSKEGTTFVFDDINLIKVSLPLGARGEKEDLYIIRNYPKYEGKVGKPPTNAPSAGSQGSCFFVSRDGVVITNYHVVDGKSEYHIIDNSGIQFEAVLEQRDPSNDLAVLRVSTSNHKYLGLAPLWIN